MDYLSPKACGLENNSDEENIGKDDEAREYPDKDSVASEILTGIILPSAAQVQAGVDEGIHGKVWNIFDKHSFDITVLIK